MASRIAALISALLAVANLGAGQPAGLPPKDVFLREARETFTRSQEEWHRFSYKERRTDMHLNPFGRMGTGAIRVFEVRPSTTPRLTYRREIERNGVPVSAEELARQDAEYQARAARVARDGDDEDDRLARKRARMMIDDVVNTLEFNLVRREVRHGKPAIVVSFAAAPKARPVTREGRLAKVFQGHIWIDEATLEVTDMNAVARDDVSFGGFIAKVYEGTEAVAERREIAPGVWMPTRLTLKGEIRALFRTAHIDHVVEWFDYQRIR